MSNKHSGAPVRLVVLNRQIEAAESMVTGSTKAVLGEGPLHIARTGVYVPNAMKYFTFVPRGKNRLHTKPPTAEVKRYRWWLVGRAGFITVHPFSLLRAPDDEARREGVRVFVTDLKAAKKLATTHRKEA
jgi:uracil-DNA glycosylase